MPLFPELPWPLFEWLLLGHTLDVDGPLVGSTTLALGHTLGVTTAVGRDADTSIEGVLNDAVIESVQDSVGSNVNDGNALEGVEIGRVDGSTLDAVELGKSEGVGRTDGTTSVGVEVGRIVGMLSLGEALGWPEGSTTMSDGSALGLVDPIELAVGSGSADEDVISVGSGSNGDSVGLGSSVRTSEGSSTLNDGSGSIDGLTDVGFGSDVEIVMLGEGTSGGSVTGAVKLGSTTGVSGGDALVSDGSGCTDQEALLVGWRNVGEKVQCGTDGSTEGSMIVDEGVLLGSPVVIVADG